MCKKGEKRESEGVSVLVFFFWRESCVQHSSSEEFRIFWPYQKKKKIPIHQKLSCNCSLLPVPFSVLKEAPAFSLGT